jgi:hypothetical protein
MMQSLSFWHFLYKEANPDGPDKGCEEEGTFEGSEKGQDSVINYLDGQMIIAKRC